MSKKKSQFKSGAIRTLTKGEMLVLAKVEKVMSGKVDKETIAKIPSFVSSDGKERPLVFSRKIAEKVIEHGKMVNENFVLNATSWEYVLRDVGKNGDKINLIKLLPNGDFIRIGANKDNGYFIVTHYENVAGKSQKLKNLLRKGDTLDRFGRTPFLT